MGKNTPHHDFSLGGRRTGKPKGNDLRPNDIKDLEKAKANPNLKNLAKVAKNPRIRNQAKDMAKSLDHPEKALKADLKDQLAGPKNSSNDPNDPENGQDSFGKDDRDSFGKDGRDSFGKDGQDSFGKDGKNPFGKFGQGSFGQDDDDQNKDKDDRDQDKDDQDQNKDDQDQNKDKDQDKDNQDKDQDKGKDKDKKGRDKNKDKSKKDHDSKNNKNHDSKNTKSKKSGSENSAAQNAKIVRRKPDNKRRRQLTQAGLKQGAKFASKDLPELFALQKAATFYDKYLAPLINAIRNRLANIGMWFKNVGHNISNWFHGATKALSGGINAAMGVFGVTMAASTVSMISSFAIFMMLVFAPLMLVYFYLFSMDNNGVNNLINYTACVVKKAISDDSDDLTETAVSSGSYKRTSLAYLKKHGISVKKYSSWNKTAMSIAKAVHKITGAKTNFVFAQVYAETGGDFSYAANTDNNFTGITGTATIKEYGATKGSPRPANEGSYYQHFKSLNGYVCEYSDTLMAVSTGKKKANVKRLKKMTNISQFNDYLKEHGYYTADKNHYLGLLNGGLNAYNNYTKNGDKGSAKVTEVDYSPDDSDSGISPLDCKVQTSGDTEASRSAIVKEAKSWVGKFHYLGKNTPTNVRFFPDVKDLSDRSSIPKDHETDCSGFVWFVLTRVGVKVPKFYTGDMENYAKAGTNHLKKIDKEDALPGDIVIMNVGSGTGGNGHTAILTTKWGGSYKNTKVVEMGGYNADKSDDVNTTNIEYAFKSLIDGGARITFARVTGLKKSSGDDDDNSSNSKVITKLSKKENAARKWIVQHESGGNYKAKNPHNPTVYGAYQLKRDYLAKGSSLGGDGTLSKKNQDYVAYKYMKQRYKTWVHAKEVWQSQHWW